MRSRLAVGLLLFSGACSLEASRSLVGPELPEEVVYTAILFADEGRLVGGTGLVRRAPGEALAVKWPEGQPDGIEVRVLGYTAASLAQLQLPPDEALARAPLSLAQATDARLPGAPWSLAGRWADGQVTLTLATDPPALAASWLPPCPSILTHALPIVDVSCRAAPCVTRATQEACTLELDLSACDLGVVFGTVLGSGAVSFASSPAVGDCATSAPGSDPVLETSCEASGRHCRLEIPRASGPRLTTRTTTVVAAPFHQPAAGVEPLGGYLSGIEVLGERVWVASADGAFGLECRGTSRGLLVAFDAETLTSTLAVATPPCLGRLRRDPEHGGLFSTFFEAGRWYLGRFDPAGRLRDRVGLPEPSAGFDLFPDELIVHQRAPLVTVLLRYTTEESAWGYLATFDRADLTLTASTAPSVDLRAVVETEPGLVVELIDGMNQLRTVDARSGRTLEVLDLGPLCGQVAPDPQRIAYGPARRELLLSSRVEVDGSGRESGDGTLMFVQEQGCRIARNFETPGDVFGFAALEADGGLIIAGTTSRSAERRARLSLVLSVPRFLVPAIDVGRGMVDDVRVDPRGRVWASLPWSGTLVRAELVR